MVNMVLKAALMRVGVGLKNTPNPNYPAFLPPFNHIRYQFKGLTIFTIAYLRGK